MVIVQASLYASNIFRVQRSLSAPNVLQAEIRTLHNGDAQDTMHSANTCLTIVQNEVFCS